MSEGWEAREQGKTRASRARLIAYDVCREVRQRNAFTHNVLDARLAHEFGLTPEDRSFAIALALGVTQTAGTLDEVIDGVLDNPRDLRPDVRDALRISAYEVLFLDKDPYAAVDQGVELVRSFNPKAKGFANAVLRRIVRAKRDFPFGDPETDLAACARLRGFPLWLAELLVQTLGKEAAQEFMAASNDPAPVYFAVNSAKATCEEVFKTLASAGADPEAVDVCGREVEGCYLLRNSRALADGRVRHLLQTGSVLVSDAASQRIAELAVQTAYASKSRDASEPVRFLEIGAGRATKTILLQSGSRRMFGRYLDMTCVDNQEFKVNLLRKRIAEFGLPSACALTADATKLAEHLGEDPSFDAVFLDAPCTGIGTLRRHPEIRWRVDEDAIRESSALQLALLESAAAQVLPGGVLVYATCTVTRDENVGVVKRFLETELGSRFRVAPVEGRPVFATSLVRGGCDAHFAVRMVRLS